MSDELSKQVSNKLSIFAFSFYFFSTIFYLLCVAVVALPILISSGLLTEQQNRFVAFISALAAAIATWSNLGTVSKNFGVAYSSLLLAKADYAVSRDEKRLGDAYQKAIEVSFQWAPGLPSTGTK